MFWTFCVFVFLEEIMAKKKVEIPKDKLFGPSPKVEPAKKDQTKEQESGKEEATPRVDEELMPPGKYEVTDEDIFKIDLWLLQKNSRWLIVDSRIPSASKEWIKFRMWTFDEEVELRKKATKYDEKNRLHYIDNDILNRLKVQKLLIEWSFGNENPRLKIHRVNGVLTDESWNSFRKLHRNIIKYILERMNGILEYNA